MAGRKKSKIAKWFCILITTLFHLFMGAAYWFLGFKLWDEVKWISDNKITVYIVLSVISFLLIIIFRLVFDGSNWFIGLGLAVAGFRFLAEFFIWEAIFVSQEEYFLTMVATVLYVMLMYLFSLGALKNDDDWYSKEPTYAKPKTYIDEYLTDLMKDM